MLFNSLEYMLFLPLVAALYFLLKPRFRWIMLLIASYWFYMSWKAEYAILILFCTAINYLSTLLLARMKSRKLRGLLLAADLILSFGVLFVYKYLGFATQNINLLIEKTNLAFRIPQFDLLLPVGISFFTFQTLSYTIDVYNGRIKPEKNFGMLALFVSFFPQLVAGPIERSESLLPQFRVVHRFNIARATNGLRIILWGLFKKIVVADRLSLIVDKVYNDITHFGAWAYIIATLAFAVQIYCDFSGYSDIAVGTAKILGYDLMQNFKRPYFSKSTGEFWRRWHISLSTWFRDYVYIPLGGNRVGKARYYFNNLITFVLSGLWHGANWTFVLWGLLNGIYVALGRATRGVREKFVSFTGLEKAPKLHRFTRVLITFSLVCLSWVLFRANSLGDAVYILKHMIPAGISADMFSGLGSRLDLAAAALGVFVLLFAEYSGRGETRLKRLFDRSIAIRFLSYLFLIVLILTFGVTGHELAFIYFQF